MLSGQAADRRGKPETAIGGGSGNHRGFDGDLRLKGHPLMIPHPRR